ncbi:MAG: SbcC/MukB-like Walker B domain-containing protein, partial [Methanoregula sp.]
IEDNTRNLDGTTLTLQQTDEYLSENQKDSNLPEIIIALDQQFKVYRSLESKLHKVISNQKIVQKNYEKAGRDFSNQTEAFDKKKQELVNVSEKFITLLESLSLILEGQDLTYWREKESRLRDNLELVRQLKETHETFNETLKELKTLSESQKKKKRDVLKNSKNLKQFQKEAQIQEKYVEQLEGKELLVARIRDLENERKLLEDKKPCPLCGSPEHPYARGNIPIPEKITTELKGERKVLKVLQGKISQLVIENAHNDSELEQNKRDREKLNKIVLECKASWTTGCQELGFDGKIADKSNEVMKLLETYEKDFSFCHELITNANKKEKDLQKIEKIVNTCKEDLSAIELARQKADSEYKTQDAEKQRLHEEHEGISAEILEAIDILANFLDKYGYQEFDPKKFPTIIKKFTNRSKEYQNQIERKQILETEKARISSEIFAYNKSLGDSHIQLTTKNALLQDREIGLHKLTVQRISIYEDKNPDDEEIKINKILKDTQESYTRILQAKHEINLNLNSIESRLDSFKKVIDSSRETLNSLEILFKYSLEKTGFTDENKFLEACLPEETFEELRALEEGLRSREIQISTRIKDKNASLSSELEKNLTNRSPEQLSEEYIMLSSRSDELKARLGAVSEIIRKNDEIKLQQKDKLGELDAQKKECDRWERLHTLIGSSDGKKFRNFAQGLTFEILISHANQHLQKMSDRYLLIRDHLASMDLNVIDNYQAGEIRSTKNLSGGESFLVSLALALGLSSMASHKVRIDSFFLDEGFGSLDDDALDTALATLSGLQQEGKLTGIISHVAAIKDRIATQIIIEKGTGGRSRLMGPGCKLKSY